MTKEEGIHILKVIGPNHHSFLLTLTVPSGSRVVNNLSSGLQERLVTCSSVIRIDGTYSLLEPEYTWIVPEGEQQANREPHDDHASVLIASDKGERKIFQFIHNTNDYSLLES